jgi:spore germination protein YaaH
LHWRQLYFDDARTLGAKWDLVRQSKLLGTGLWAAGFEDPRPELYRVIREKFLTAD